MHVTLYIKLKKDVEDTVILQILKEIRMKKLVELKKNSKQKKALFV